MFHDDSGKGGMTVEEKRVSAAQRKATDKYLEKFDEIRIRIPKGQKELVRIHAGARGESVNGFISRAISETIERDGGEMAPKIAGKHPEPI